MAKALEGLSGVKKVEFPKGTKMIVVVREPGKPSDEEIIRTLDQVGQYSPRRIKE